MHSGLIAEFDAPELVLAAGRRVAEIGCRRVEVYSPFPIEGLDRALGRKRPKFPFLVLVAALVGIGLAFTILWLCNAYDYPLNVGGRPLNSFPADVPIMFETGVLFASLTAFGLAIVTARLPRWYDDMCEIDGFERTTIDRFWLTVDATDPRYGTQLADELRAIGARSVRVVGRVS